MPCAMCVCVQWLCACVRVWCVFVRVVLPRRLSGLYTVKLMADTDCLMRLTIDCSFRETFDDHPTSIAGFSTKHFPVSAGT